MKIITLKKARKRMHSLVEELQTFHEPVLLTGTGGNVVLVSGHVWRGIQETLYLVSIPGMRESIIEGMDITTSQMSAALDW